MKTTRATGIVLYSMLVCFVLIVGYFVQPWGVEGRQAMFILLAILGVIFLLLGVVMVLQALKENGRCRIMYMLTGIAGILPLPGAVLHNVMYGLGQHFVSWQVIFEFLGGVFFILALLVAPVLFLIGIVGSLICFHKKA